MNNGGRSRPAMLAVMAVQVNRARQVADGPVDTIRGDEKVQEIYLGGKL